MSIFSCRLLRQSLLPLLAPHCFCCFLPPQQQAQQDDHVHPAHLDGCKPSVFMKANHKTSNDTRARQTPTQRRGKITIPLWPYACTNNCYRTLSAGPRIYGATTELMLLLAMHMRRDEMGWDQKRYTASLSFGLMHAGCCCQLLVANHLAVSTLLLQ